MQNDKGGDEPPLAPRTAAPCGSWGAGVDDEDNSQSEQGDASPQTQRKFGAKRRRGSQCALANEKFLESKPSALVPRG